MIICVCVCIYIYIYTHMSTGIHVQYPLLLSDCSET